MESKKRIDKKRHRQWLSLGIIDASQKSYWRQKLFSASFYDQFEIDSENCTDLDEHVIDAIKKYKLRYRVTKIPNSEVQYWFNGSDLVVFKFFAVDYPSVVSFTANNPKVK